MHYKKLIARLVISTIVVATFFGSYQVSTSNSSRNIVLAAKSTSVEEYIDHITLSIKTNYLGLKNVGQWQQYIEEARALNGKLQYGATKRKNESDLDKIEALVNAAARVNQVEKSMDVNALSMKNVKQWEYYIDLAKSDLEKVDLYSFRYQHSELSRRAKKKQEEINSIKKEYYKNYNEAENMYFDAIKLEDSNMEEALRRAKVAKEVTLRLQSHETKDFLIEREERLIKRLDDDIVARANGVYKRKYIINNSDIESVNNSTYNEIIIDTWNDFTNRRITHLTANTVVIRSGSDIVLNNCNIGRLIVQDYSNNINIKVEGKTTIERGIVRSGASFNRTEDFIENHIDPMKSVPMSMEVDTRERVWINTQVAYLSMNARDSKLSIDSYVGTVKLNSPYSTLTISKNGIVDKLYVNTFANNSLIEGSGKLVKFEDLSYGTKMRLDNPPVK